MKTLSVSVTKGLVCNLLPVYKLATRKPIWFRDNVIATIGVLLFSVYRSIAICTGLLRSMLDMLRSHSVAQKFRTVITMLCWLLIIGLRRLRLTFISIHIISLELYGSAYFTCQGHPGIPGTNGQVASLFVQLLSFTYCAVEIVIVYSLDKQLSFWT